MNPLGDNMSEGEETSDSNPNQLADMPFRLHDINLKFELSNINSVLKPVDTIRKEIKFMTLLAYSEWGRDLITALLVGTLAFILGSLSAEIFSGGNPDVVGLEGLKKVGSFSFFQMLLSIVAWVWFAYLVLTKFPVMRVHSVSLLLMWNGMMFLQVLFHEKNTQFPTNMVLSDMMSGVLIILVILFFTYFFWKAVIETRDLHVQIHHVHEDVRVMEREMGEHSLVGWGSLLVFWLIITFYSSWSGVHYIAQRTEPNSFYYIMHIISGLFIVPVFMLLIWYPQRMLGSDVRISTAAAITAEIEMKQGGLVINETAKCPECEESIELKRETDGQISIPCPSESCNSVFGIIGTVCKICKEKFPSRFECKSCGINSPYIDCVPDMEAW